MKRIKITTICMSLLATLSMVGCVCPPAYHSGIYRSGYVSNDIAYGGACDPCGPAEPRCGEVIEYGGNPCASIPYAQKPADCRTAFSHLGNGVLLVGRGVLDVAAAPFVTVGNALSSGCRYEVLAHCDNVYYTSPCYPTIDPCEPAACTSGCETCANGYTEGIQYNMVPPNRFATLLPPQPRTGSGVVQASYQEPTAPAAKFVHPSR